jgi:hypothetical protein
MGPELATATAGEGHREAHSEDTLLPLSVEGRDVRYVDWAEAVHTSHVVDRVHLGNR